MNRAAFSLFAKEPVPGRVKTRLAPPLTPAQAAAIYAAFVRDTLAILGAGCGRDADIVLCTDPAPSHAPQLAAIARAANARLAAQSAGDLGARLFGALERCRLDGRPYSAVVGADHPTLPVAVLVELRSVMDAGADAAIIASNDGGYCAFAARAARAEWFAGIPWSTPRVLAETIAALETSGVEARVLGPWYDVDRPGDLDRLAGEIARLGPQSPGFPRQSAALLAELGWAEGTRRREPEERISRPGVPAVADPLPERTAE